MISIFTNLMFFVMVCKEGDKATGPPEKSDAEAATLSLCSSASSSCTVQEVPPSQTTTLVLGQSSSMSDLSSEDEAKKKTL